MYAEIFEATCDLQTEEVNAPRRPRLVPVALPSRQLTPAECHLAGTVVVSAASTAIATVAAGALCFVTGSFTLSTLAFAAWLST